MLPLLCGRAFRKFAAIVCQGNDGAFGGRVRGYVEVLPDYVRDKLVIQRPDLSTSGRFVYLLSDVMSKSVL